MAKSIHVKAKTQWKRLSIPKNVFDEKAFDGLVDVQELTDYEFIRTDKPKKKPNKRKAPDQPDTTESKRQKSEAQSGDKSTVKKKKGNNRRKNKNQTEVTNNDRSNKVIDVTSLVAENNVQLQEKTIQKGENGEVNQSDENTSSKKKKKNNRRKKKNQTEVVDDNGGAEQNDKNTNSKKKKGKKKSETNISCDTSQAQSVDVVDSNYDKSATISQTDTNKTKRKKNTSKKSVLPTEESMSMNEESATDHSEIDMSKWSNLFVPDVLLRSLRDQKFENPTTIQVLTLPSAIRDRKDILAAAETGSGKTLAFGIPVVANILSHKQQCEQDIVRENDERDENDDDGGSDEDYDFVNGVSEEPDEAPEKSNPPMALILEPTRELAVQVHRHLTNLAKHTNIRFAIVVGGMSVEKQRRILKHCPEVIVATPGRLWQLIEEGDEHLRQMDLIHSLVVDEADRMVEKGHYEELTKLLHMVNKSPRRDVKRQSFVMSATLTMEIALPKRVVNKVKKEKDLEKDKLKSLTTKICVGTKPKVIDLTPKDKVAQSLTEMRINCNAKEKDFYLYYFLTQHPGRTLVFANSKDCLRRLVSVFTLLECSPYPLHADMQQRQRLKNLDRFSSNSQGLLLASDVAARGLDIPNVDYVLHYQVPQTMENYVHRSGRTARASNVGLSVMLVAPEDARNYRKIVHGVKNGEELPILPIDLDLLPSVKNRVQLARTIDVAEHRFKKIKLHNDFFSKAAEEMDMILDDKNLIPELDDSVTEAEGKNEIKQMRYELSAVLQGSIAPLRMTKYPTKSGKLLSMKSVNLLNAR